MSLMVWLPLNGDLTNQGLSNITIAASGAVVNATGKIGSCYSFDGSDDYISLVGDSINNCFKGGTQQFSIAFWVYRADATRGIVFGDFGLANAINFNFELNTAHQFRFYWDGSPDKVFSAGITASAWNHVVLTYDGTIMKYYINGVLKENYTITLGAKSKASGAAWYLGRDSRTGTTALNGRLNDFRLYNHCLSAKEVKEISKGLVLHYKLTSNEYGNPNLLLNSQTYNLNQTGTTRLYVGQRLDTSIYPLSNVIGKTFTVSYDISMEGNFSPVSDTPSWDTSGTRSGPYASVSYNGGSVTYYTPHINQKGKGRKFFNFTIPSSWTSVEYITINLEINGYPSNGQEWSIRNVKLEEGTKATPYAPNYQENIYEVLGFNSTTEYDCSGYKHNGTKVNVKTSSDSPRYNSSEAFLGTTVDNSSNTLTGAAYITAGLPLPASSALTVSWWGKITKYGRGGIFETTAVTSDYVNGTDYNSTAIANWDGIFRVYNGSSYVNLYSNMGIPNSSWQLNTITFDGTNVKYYKNGSLVSTNALSGTLPAFNGIKIGIGKAGGVYRQIQQYVSDFRIYVTALSAEEVKELYQIPISVDKLGNAFGMEFIEDQKPEFHKNGTIENNYIHENEADDSDSLTTFHVGKTKTFANQIYEI